MKSRMWQAKNINSKSFQHWRSMSSIANSTLSLAHVFSNKKRNRGCGKQETWTRNCFNTEDQGGLLLILCFLLLLSPLTKWEIEDVASKKYELEIFSTLKINEFYCWFYVSLAPVSSDKMRNQGCGKEET